MAMGTASNRAMTKRQRATHIFDKDPLGHYPEPQWTAARLFEVESFGAESALVYDPCCGWGRIPHAAVAAGYTALGIRAASSRAT
jgi:hypothetical protein